MYMFMHVYDMHMYLHELKYTHTSVRFIKSCHAACNLSQLTYLLNITLQASFVLLHASTLSSLQHLYNIPLSNPIRVYSSHPLDGHLD